MHTFRLAFERTESAARISCLEKTWRLDNVASAAETDVYRIASPATARSQMDRERTRSLVNAWTSRSPGPGAATPRTKARCQTDEYLSKISTTLVYCYPARYSE